MEISKKFYFSSLTKNNSPDYYFFNRQSEQDNDNPLKKGKRINEKISYKLKKYKMKKKMKKKKIIMTNKA